jgi:hypothetical protein
MSGAFGLGSLAQSARGKQLKTARGILLVIGGLTIVANFVFFAMIESQIDQEIQKEVQNLRARGLVANQIEIAKVRESAIRVARLVQGVAIFLGVVFVVFGFLVQSYPVPITITALVLYVGAAAVFGLLDPTTLLQGLIMKVIIVVALAKSIQAALAYERERQTMAMQSELPPA